MIQTANAVRLEYGIYRDGDNNLDSVQTPAIDQALEASANDPAISFSIENTTALWKPGESDGNMRTEEYAIDRGHAHDFAPGEPDTKDMSARATLAEFVAKTLDRAQANHAAATWIELVDHGGGDAGGLEADWMGTSPSGCMSEDDIAGAIRDGVKMHAQAHPDDASRRVDGVVANMCLMSTLGFADALSHAGVRYLAASPEVMLAPGVPSQSAIAIEQHLDDPKAMASALTSMTMRKSYGVGEDTWHPAAAFDVLDLDPHKIARMENAVKGINDAIAADAQSQHVRSAIRADAREFSGMARFDDHTMPWHADRPAAGVYGALAGDARLPDDLRSAAREARAAVNDLVLSHRESRNFEPYGGVSYRDVTGPTVHFPLTRGQVDAWGPQISETDNAFYNAVDGPQIAKAIA